MYLWAKPVCLLPGILSSWECKMKKITGSSLPAFPHPLLSLPVVPVPEAHLCQVPSRVKRHLPGWESILRESREEVLAQRCPPG